MLGKRGGVRLAYARCLGARRDRDRSGRAAGRGGTPAPAGGPEGRGGSGSSAEVPATRRRGSLGGQVCTASAWAAAGAGATLLGGMWAKRAGREPACGPAARGGAGPAVPVGGNGASRGKGALRISCTRSPAREPFPGESQEAAVAWARTRGPVGGSGRAARREARVRFCVLEVCRGRALRTWV